MFKKRIPLLVLMCIFFSMHVWAYSPEIISNTNTMYKPDARELTQIHRIESLDEKIAENEFLTLYLNEKDLSIKVEEKTSGYIYSSNDVNTDSLNALWKGYVNSPVTVKYIDNNNKINQESLYQHPQSSQKVSITDDGFSADLFFAQSQIRLTYGVRLEEDSILIYLNDDSIVEELSTLTAKQADKQGAQDSEEKPEAEMTAKERLLAKKKTVENYYDLHSITLYPFLGALEAGQQDGYTIIPDGSGALIRYDKEHKGINIPYEKLFYGSDKGIPFDGTSESSNYNTKYSSDLYFRLYGMVHGIGQSGFLTIIEDGGEYGNLVSYPAGVTTDFYFTTVEYLYNTTFQQRISHNQTITSKLDKRNTVNIKERYKFVQATEANFTGIANAYKNYLLDNDSLNTYNVDQVPLSLYTITEVMKKGFIRNYMEVITTTDDIVDMESYLHQQGINNVYYSISANRENLTGKPQDSKKLNKKIEGKYSFEEMNEYLKDNNSMAFIATDLGTNYGNGKIETDVIRQVNKEYAQSKRKRGNKNYITSYLSNEGSLKNLSNNLKRINDNSFQGLLNLNNTPPSTNFGKNNYATRKASLENNREMGQKIKENGSLNGSAFAYDFTLKNLDVSFNTIRETTIYPFVTDTIPFYQIVLSGNIPMFADALNNNPDLQEVILKCIEYNLYPQFDVVNSDYNKMEGAISSGTTIFTVEFDRWKEKIVESYDEIADILNEVVGEAILKHEMLAPRIPAITYSNGKTIIVNYTDENFEYKGELIKGKGSEIIW